jgi:hypothetical protein
MRNLVGLAVAVAPLLTSVSCCWLCKPLVHGDVVPGASKGSALVKVLVTLKAEAGNCVIDPRVDVGVNPTRVRVFRGSVIRWRVVNNCTKPPVNYLKFTQPKPIGNVKAGEYGEPKPWDFRFCTPTIATLSSGDDEKNVLICEVPQTAVPGLYKYNVEGAAKQDPEIEVRKGG